MIEIGFALFLRYYLGKDPMGPWTGDGPIPYSHSQPLIELVGDGLFGSSAYFTALQLSQAGAPVYLFEMSHKPSFS